MLKLALEEVPNAEIRTLELEREGPSYSIDTVRALHSEFNSTPLRLLIGDDQAVSFHRWKDWDPIIDLAEPLVLPRRWATPDSFSQALAQEGPPWTDDDIQYWLKWRVDLPCMEMCSEDVRRRLEIGHPVDDHLDPAVLDYIIANGLYQ
jgi:nicotinate-nucleotide adenylyltransferase